MQKFFKKVSCFDGVSLGSFRFIRYCMGVKQSKGSKPEETKNENLHSNDYRRKRKIRNGRKERKRQTRRRNRKALQSKRRMGTDQGGRLRWKPSRKTSSED